MLAGPAFLCFHFPRLAIRNSLPHFWQPSYHHKLILRPLVSHLSLPASFAEFMQAALYAPSSGYYARAPEVGRRGDFYTSVSVGPVFGELIAAAAHQAWAEQGSPQEYVIYEQGAHSGQLMRDVLDALQRQYAALYATALPCIEEPLPALRTWQQETLALHPQVIWAEPKSQFRQGFLYANELLDAFPVHVVRYQGGHWVELGISGPPWHWEPLLELTPGLAEQLLEIFPDTSAVVEGYTTELCPAVDAWMAEKADLFASGHFLLLDYGWEREAYYAPHRTQGTLSAYQQHRRLTQMPQQIIPGETDITAHVDWTRLNLAAAKAGLQEITLQSQSTFLSKKAIPFLTNIASPPTAAQRRWITQFNQLTHPTHLGMKFQAWQAVRRRRRGQILSCGDI
jgi:SAM-dependent MidA family methyltransferase